MATYPHMPNYDIRNDGAGPYAVFYCDVCNREFRSQPDIASSIKQDIGRSAVSSLLRKVPLVVPRLGLDLPPIAAFAIISYGLIGAAFSGSTPGTATLGGCGAPPGIVGT